MKENPVDTGNPATIVQPRVIGTPFAKGADPRRAINPKKGKVHFKTAFENAIKEMQAKMKDGKEVTMDEKMMVQTYIAFAKKNPRVIMDLMDRLYGKPKLVDVEDENSKRDFVVKIINYNDVTLYGNNKGSGTGNTGNGTGSDLASMGDGSVNTPEFVPEGIL